EGAGGIVGYACDAQVRIATFAFSSRLWLADLVDGRVQELPAVGPVVDPRPDPTGRHVAYASQSALRLVTLGEESAQERALVEPDAETVVWGLAEFIAAEELSRTRGFWWAPDGSRLLVERYDEAPVERWHLADPAHPERSPVPVRYPAAGTANAAVSLWLVDLEGNRREVEWDRDRFPYLAEVTWTSDGPPLLYVLT